MDARGDLALRVSGGLERLSGGSGCRLPPHPHPTGAGRIAARGSRPARSQPAPRCAASGPSSLLSLTGPSTVQVCCLRPLSPSSGRRLPQGCLCHYRARSGPRRLRHEPLLRHQCVPGRRLHHTRGRSCRSRSLHAE